MYYNLICIIQHEPYMSCIMHSNISCTMYFTYTHIRTHMFFTINVHFLHARSYNTNCVHTLMSLLSQIYIHHSYTMYLCTCISQSYIRPLHYIHDHFSQSLPHTSYSYNIIHIHITFITFHVLRLIMSMHYDQTSYTYHILLVILFVIYHIFHLYALSYTHSMYNYTS